MSTIHRVRDAAKAVIAHPHVTRVTTIAQPVITPVAAFAKARPYIAGLLCIGVLGGGYWAYTRTDTALTTTYTVGTVEKGTLVISVAGTGQVSASNQVDLKAKVSGDVTSLPVHAGQTVKLGAPLLSIDARDAQKTVRDARTSLASAQLSLDKAKQPADALTVAQAQNAIAASNDTLAKSYDDGYNDISNAFLDLPSVMAGLDTILYDTTLSSNRSQANIDAYMSLIDQDDSTVRTFRDDAATKYTLARKQYDVAFAHYRTLTRAIDDATTETEIKNTYALVKTIADSVKSTYDYLSYVKDRLQTKQRTIPTLLLTHESNLNGFTSETNAHLTSLLSVINAITTTKRNLTEQTQKLKDVEAGTEVLDIESARLAVVQRQNSLQDALEKLSDYTVRAPFTGTIASLDIQRGQSVSSGSAFGVLITKEKVAEVTFNEVDIAKVKIGQKATLTFDAVDTLTITGSVISVDTIGTVNQGVVTYTVKIGFDTQDERIRPGMSVSANIITTTKQDTLLVPASAVKTNSTGSYVEVPPRALTTTEQEQKSGITFTTAPTQKYVDVGLSDDTSTEILSGISEGDTIITRSVKTATTTATPSATSLFGAMRGPGGGGGFGGTTRSGNGGGTQSR